MKSIRTIAFCCLALVATSSVYAVPCPTSPATGWSLTALKAAYPGIYNKVIENLPENRPDLTNWNVIVTPEGDNCAFTFTKSAVGEPAKGVAAPAGNPAGNPATPAPIKVLCSNAGCNVLGN